ncbi:hypothetical protein F4814DRAFT_460058 [Daldinia grandis]|nr:hypothetical protein F4814DRAFT_460058 [Daldinia grandis]
MSSIQQTVNAADAKQIVANEASPKQPRESKDGPAGKESGNPVNSEAGGSSELSDDATVYARDALTGRLLAEDGESCLRCIDKELKCTLIFLGFETEAKCAACRRSNSQYCIRQRRPQDCFKFYGRPWNSPNYFAVGESPSLAEMEEILREHFLAKDIDWLGTYLYVYDPKQRNMALPPFNGSDLPASVRPEDFKSKTWKDVLPILQNKSALRRLKDGEAEENKTEEEKAEEKKIEAEAIKASVAMLSAPGFAPKTRKPRGSQRSRYYPVRAMHVSEYLANNGETLEVQITQIEQKYGKSTVDHKD